MAPNQAPGPMAVVCCRRAAGQQRARRRAPPAAAPSRARRAAMARATPARASPTAVVGRVTAWPVPPRRASTSARQPPARTTSPMTATPPPTATSRVRGGGASRFRRRHGGQPTNARPLAGRRSLAGPGPRTSPMSSHPAPPGTETGGPPDAACTSRRPRSRTTSSRGSWRVTAGLSAGLLSVVGFGLDSGIESISAVLVALRLVGPPAPRGGRRGPWNAGPCDWSP